MRSIEYDTRFEPSKRLSIKVREILYKVSTNQEIGLPSDLLIEVIEESGWGTDWAYVHSHSTLSDTPIRSDQPQRYEIFGKIEKQLTPVEHLLRDVFVGKNVLDLGCGAKSGFFESGSTSKGPGCYEPWLARVLHKLGANVIGIDVGNLKHEKFRAYNLDLLEPGSLNLFQDDYFDLVHSSALYTSLELQLRVQGSANDGSLEAGKILAELLKPQIQRILKPDGIYLLREEVNYLLDKRLLSGEATLDGGWPKDIKDIYSPQGIYDQRDKFEDI